MTPAAASRRAVPAAPWRPSPAQARLLGAVLDASEAGPARLEAWCRHDARLPLDDDARALLPFVLDRLIAIDAPAGIIEEAAAACRERARLNLSRVGRLLGVLRQFDDAGIAAVVLKGAALALRYYGTFGTRAMADVDLLVRPGDVPRAVALLAALGWTPGEDVSPAVLRTRMRVNHALSFGAEPPHSLDLHWRVSNVASPDVHDLLWASVETFDVSETPVQVLGPTDQIFHVIVHAVQPSWAPTPRWMVDVCAILDSAGARVRWDRLVDIARRTNTNRRVLAAIADLDRISAGRFPTPVRDALTAIQSPAWERRELALFEGLPPYGPADVLRWHWYQFRRLRAFDPTWQSRPVLAGYADYVRLKWRLRRRAAWVSA